MTTNLQTASDPALELAREALYRFLAAALSDPHTRGWRLLFNSESQRLACEAADLLREEAGAQPMRLGFGELPPGQLALEPLLAELCKPLDELCDDYDRVFGLVLASECQPYETEYHPNAEAFFRSQQMADVAGFYRAFGLEPSQADPERPDHIALELEFMAFLLMKKRFALATVEQDPAAPERAAVCDGVQRSFFRDHLAWWVPSFATGLRRRAATGFYAALGQVLAAFMPAERRRLGVDTPSVPMEATYIERPEEQMGCAGCALAR